MFSITINLLVKMATGNKNGCTYGQVLKQRVDNIQENMDTGFNRMEKQLTKINETQADLFNHMSNRMTKGQVTMWCALIGVICALLGVLGTFGIALLKT